jgi:hypothetical protein
LTRAALLSTAAELAKEVRARFSLCGSISTKGVVVKPPRVDHREVVSFVAGLLLLLIGVSSACAGSPIRGVTSLIDVRGIAGSPVAISADARYVGFVSGGGGFNPSVLVRDRRRGLTTLVSVTADGSPPDGPSGECPCRPFCVPVAISGDGRYVAFTSWASNLVPGETSGIYERVFVRDLVAGVTTEVGDGELAAISADGRHVVFISGNGSGYAQVLVRNTDTGPTAEASVASDGSEGNSGSGGAAISPDGRYVAFVSGSSAGNLTADHLKYGWNLFVRDRFGVPRLCVPPNLKGSTLAQGRSRLAANRCVLGTIGKAFSSKVPKSRIIAQSQPPGKRLSDGTRVNVVVSRGPRR